MSPDGAGLVLGIGFYKDAAPLALDDVRVAAVVEYADVGDGLPERGGIVDRQFRAVIFPVTLGG